MAMEQALQNEGELELAQKLIESEAPDLLIGCFYFALCRTGCRSKRTAAKGFAHQYDRQLRDRKKKSLFYHW